ncbi:CmeU family protein [Campylobacter vulpis]|uniref:Chain-length determining protein n=1 Tax=Campylobacter vulpis TaxID=1655500 RepID=A0A2G4R5I1_9BACT|nr:CmeU family protein [Campylobacter vulpis]MBS4234820.1 hypothetical protein [Campylobacter vulpis]MBS4240570.1 hypothetical protein [Campylobacter vulpis]MBS4251985.1 hypothetical protein [Campylobacter vulpis]MBS4268409.1 hypothetical protein [Campylobacter vulpis]MBS4274873.1 hypothetical protein [Campylobacter vulpis]
MEKEQIVVNLKDFFAKREEFFQYFDTHLSKKENIDAFDFSKKNELNAEEVYKQFYHFDYAIRKLLPPLFKAYEINPSKDLKK